MATTSQAQIPQTVRIKRKRNQDPLEALLVDNNQSKDSSFVFKLAGTFEEEPGDPTDVLLQQDESKSSVYRVAKRQKRDLAQLARRTPRQRAQEKTHNVPSNTDPQAMSSLNDMVESYLHENDNSKPPSSSTSTTRDTSTHTVISPVLAEAEVEDYVYDIYYRHMYTTQDPETKPGVSPRVGLM